MTVRFSKKILLATLIPTLMHQAYANDVISDLGTLNITAEPSPSRLQNQTLDNTLVTSNEDLTRYQTDMAVPTTGRFGSQGFNIRGVENNRVSVQVDGVSQADSQNYATFSRYSYYNKGRPEVDTELMKSVLITKGADTVGSGALGGVVSYQTKSAKDILLPNRKLGASIKHTYNGKNKEWTNTLGTALDTGVVDALAIYSHRKGEEEQTTSTGPDIFGSGRGLPNPYTTHQYSYLAKAGLNFGDIHRLELKALKTKNRQNGQELSYSTITLRDYFDIKEVESYGLRFSSKPQLGQIDLFELGLDHQDSKISGTNHQISIARGTLTDDTKRTFHTKLSQGHLYAKLKPIQIGNTSHTPFAKAGYGTSDFSFEMTTFSPRITPSDTDMQAPVKTRQSHLVLGDEMRFGKLGANLSLRYDQTKLNPEDSSVQDKTFNNFSGTLGMSYALHPNWQLDYTLTSGYRVPTASEMYFNRTITSQMGNQLFLANNDLKAETSLGHQIGLTAKSDLGKLNASIYHTDYKNMIDLATLASTNNNATYQSQNLHRATIKGIDVHGALNFAKGIELSAGLGYAKGEQKNGADVLSVQPLKGVLGIGYYAPSQDWSIKLLATHHGAKKAKDAQTYAILPNSGYLSYADTLSTYPYLNKSATTLDLLASKKFGEQATFNLGLYNLTNKRYHTWDSLRTIGSTNPSVSTAITGEGLNRYLAPERYIMASVEVKF